MKLNAKRLWIFAGLIFLLWCGFSHAQDQGVPDTVVVGNLDGSPIYLTPNLVIDIPVWLKNDEDVAFVLIPVGTEDAYIEGRLGGNLYSPLDVWDDASFVPADSGYPNQPGPGYSTQSILGFWETAPPYNSPPLNTDGSYVKIADFTIQGSPDSINFGDTTMIIEGNDPAQGGILFSDSNFTVSWSPAFIGGAIIFVEEIAPTVISVYPSENAADIQVGVDITVTFDMDMDESSINDTTFLVYAQSAGLRQGIISYDSLSRTATFDPIVDFSVGEMVTVTITEGVKSSGGTPLEFGFIWSFTTYVPESGGDFGSIIDIPAGYQPKAIAGADLEGDNDVDFVIVNSDSNSVSVLFCNCDSTLSYEGDYPTGLDPKSACVADFDNDDDIDVAVANSGSNDVTILRNNGNGTLTTFRETYDTGGSSWTIFSADFNGDGNIDLATANIDSNTVAILMNNGDGTFQPYISYAVGNAPVVLFAADLDNDNDIDIIVGDSGSDSISVLLNNGSGGFPTLDGSYDTGGGNWGIFCADFNRDSFLDVALAHPNSGTVAVLFNNGEGQFPTINGSYDTGGSSWGLFGADFDGDNDIDLAVSNSDSGDVAVMLNDGNGGFPASPTSYSTDGDDWGLIVGDLDCDGSTDIVVTNTDPGGVTILFNGIVCNYAAGDANDDGSYNGLDIVFGVAYFKGGPLPPYQCDCPLYTRWFVAGDANGDCLFNGLDIGYGVTYLKGGPELVPCSNCPPPSTLRY